MATLLFTHPASLEHHMPEGHPERVDRMHAVARGLSSPDFDALIRRDAPLGGDAAILLAHSAAHLTRMRASSPQSGFKVLDPDTAMSPGTLEAALRAVGAATAAVDAVFSGEAENAFCALRPPGHHAERDRAMGFCLFNHAAIAALHARAIHGVKRVAVIDFDVHHGNGTQNIFWSDPDLFYGSTHQMPLYPGTGGPHETGAGNIVNVALRAGDGGQPFRAAMTTRILPALDAFAPDFLVISAGFDAHRRDPLGGLALDESDFAWITRRLMDLAAKHCGGRVVSILEGGYDLEALASSAAAHVRALMGMETDDR